MIETDKIILKEVYNVSLNDCNNSKKGWMSSLKVLLYTYGFNDVWDYPDSVNSNMFVPLFKQRVIDYFMQSWNTDKENSSVLCLFNHVKTSFVYENYLDILPNNLRFFLTRIRISSHSLNVQVGRYQRNRTIRSERYCVYCNLRDVEDEYHFILICPCYRDLREKYIKRFYYFRPSMYKFIEMVKSGKRNILLNLCIYIKSALLQRISTTISNTE